MLELSDVPADVRGDWPGNGRARPLSPIAQQSRRAAAEHPPGCVRSPGIDVSPPQADRGAACPTRHRLARLAGHLTASRLQSLTKRNCRRSEWRATRNEKLVLPSQSSSASPTPWTHADPRRSERHRRPPLPPVAPHQPRPARDAAHSLERGGVVAGQGRVQASVSTAERDPASGVVQLDPLRDSPLFGR